MIPDTPRVFPIRVLIALTAAVMLVHLLLLQASPVALGLNPPTAPPQPTFITRAVTPTLTGPATAAHPATAAPAAPKRRSHTTRTATPRLQPDNAQAEQPLAPTTPEPPEQSFAKPSHAPSETEVQGDPVAVADLQGSVPRPPREFLPVIGIDKLPNPVRLSYRVQTNKFPFTLNSELSWRHDGESYTARLEFSAFGRARVQTSGGAITREGLAPRRFSDKYRTEVAAHFDRDRGKVTFSANTPDTPLLAGGQDRLSVLVQLAALVASDPGAYPEATTLTIQTIGPRDADFWLFTVGREETLSLPGGDLATLKLVRNPRREFDQTVELWLAPALGYLPARIRITDASGAYVDQKWMASDPPT